MKLALVFNPFKYKIHEENILIVQKYFGLFPPLSLAWVAAIAEQAGHEVIIIDSRTLRLSKKETLKRLNLFKPDIMGFMMTTYMFPDTLEWIRYLKNNLNIPVVIGGYNLRVYPRESVSFSEIDFGVLEHAYYTIPALFKELVKENPNFDNVPGLVYKKNKKVIVTPHFQKIDFNKFPNPARHLLSNELYAEFPTERKNFTVMVTSLGCPYNCRFCEAGNTNYNARSPEIVINEIEECYYKYNIREIDFFDYEFTCDRERVLKICNLIKERNINISWACRSRVDTVDKVLLEKMKEAGCSRIYFGIESGVQEILDKVGKGVTVKQISNIIDICGDLKIKTLGFFLIGAPGDTKEIIKKTVKFAMGLNLEYVQFSKCLAKPLTSLWEDLISKTGVDYWKEWVLGRETDRVLPRPWTELTNDDIDRLTKWAYIKYYSRPLFIVRALLNLKSFVEFKRKLFAYIDMCFFQKNIAVKDEDFLAYNENVGLLSKIKISGYIRKLKLYFKKNRKSLKNK